MVTDVNHLDATLERPDDAEPVGVVDDAEVGKPPGSDGAPVMEPEPPGSGERGHAERLLDLEATRNRFPDTVIDMPSRASISACRSSVAKQHRAAVQASTSGRRSRRFCSVEPSRIMMYIPRRSFSLASANVVHSWSLWTPA